MHRRGERGVWVQGAGRLDGFHIPPSLFINSIQHGARIELFLISIYLFGVVVFVDLAL